MFGVNLHTKLVRLSTSMNSMGITFEVNTQSLSQCIDNFEFCDHSFREQSCSRIVQSKTQKERKFRLRCTFHVRLIDRLWQQIYILIPVHFSNNTSSLLILLFISITHINVMPRKQDSLRKKKRRTKSLNAFQMLKEKQGFSEKLRERKGQESQPLSFSQIINHIVIYRNNIVDKMCAGCLDGLFLTPFVESLVKKYSLHLSILK